jgi:hypothetical protein
VRHCRLLGAVVFGSIVREERGCRCGPDLRKGNQA